MLTHQKCASIPLIYSTEAMHHNETHSLAIHVVDFCGLLSIAASHYCVHSGTTLTHAIITKKCCAHIAMMLENVTAYPIHTLHPIYSAQSKAMSQNLS